VRLVVLGKILTLDNLRKMSVMVVEWCCMCNKSWESIDHLLIHCEVAKKLWSSILKMFAIDWVMPRRVRDLLECLGGRVGRGNVMEVWRLASLYVMWCIWR
jgi:hypothetical protein